MKDKVGNRGATSGAAARGLVLWGILGLALALWLAYVARLPPGSAFGSVDAKGYRILALNLLEGGVFVPQMEPAGLLSALRMPLYPAFLAPIMWVFGQDGRAIPLVQAVADTATVALVYGMVLLLANQRRAWLAALIYALNPITHLFTGPAMTEVLLAFLLALTFLAFFVALSRDPFLYSLLAVTGLLCGLCILCKPNVVLLPLILGLAVIVHQRRLSWPALKQAGLLASVALLVLLPWLVRNRLVFGEWFLSLAFEDNLAHVSAVATVLQDQGEEVAPWTPRWEETYMEQVVIPASRRYGWAEGEGSVPAREAVRRRGEMASVATGIIRQHPAAFVSSHFEGALRSFVPSLHRYWYAFLTGEPWPQGEALRTALGRVWGEAGGKTRPIAWRCSAPGGGGPAAAQLLYLASLLLHGLAYVLVLAGLWALRTRPAVALSPGLTLLYLLLLPGPIAYLRFWVPALPLAAVLMGCAFYRRRATEPHSLM